MIEVTNEPGDSRRSRQAGRVPNNVHLSEKPDNKGGARYVVGFIVLGLVVSVICVALLTACSTPAGIAKREARRHRTELEKSKFASPFQKSLFQKFGEDRSREKVMYEAQLYLLEFIAERSGSNSTERRSLDSLLALDIQYDSVAIDNLFDQGLSSLDPTFGIEVDSFNIKHQIAKRVDWILEWGGYAPSSDPPFDELGRRVVQGGIPEVWEWHH